MLEGIGRFDRAEIIPVGERGENFSKVVAAGGGGAGRLRPRAEKFRGDQFAGGQLTRGHALQRCQRPVRADGLYMPRVAARVGDDGEPSRPLRPGEVAGDGETLVGVGRARLQHLPGAQGHGDGAGAEHRAGAFAKNKSADFLQLQASLFQQGFGAGEDSRAGLLDSRLPQGGRVAAQQPGLRAGRRRVEHEDTVVMSKELSEGGHRAGTLGAAGQMSKRD